MVGRRGRAVPGRLDPLLQPRARRIAGHDPDPEQARGREQRGRVREIELRPTDAWSLRIAGRYDNLWYVSEDRFDPTLNATKRFTQITPKGSISLPLAAHDLRLAGRRRRGARVQRDRSAGAVRHAHEPQSLPRADAVREYELGAKGDPRREGGVSAGSLRRGDLSDRRAERHRSLQRRRLLLHRRRVAAPRRGARPDWLRRCDARRPITASENEYIDYANDLGDFAGTNCGAARTFGHAEAGARSSQGSRRRARNRTSAPTSRTTPTPRTFRPHAAGRERRAQARCGSDSCGRSSRAATSRTSSTSRPRSSTGSADSTSRPGLPSNVSGGLSISWR